MNSEKVACQYGSENKASRFQVVVDATVPGQVEHVISTRDVTEHRSLCCTRT